MEVNLLQVLESVRPLPLALQTHIGSILKHQVIRKNQHILKAGQVNDRICFIQRGLLWTYYMKGDKKVASWIMGEGDFLVSIVSFYKQEPSYEYIQALEETEVFYITFSELQEAYEKYLEFDYVGLKLTIKYLVELAERLYSIQMTTAQERLEWLQKNKPELIKRVPAKILACFIGISAEHFSVVRKRGAPKRKRALRKAS